MGKEVFGRNPIFLFAYALFVMYTIELEALLENQESAEAGMNDFSDQWLRVKEVQTVTGLPVSKSLLYKEIAAGKLASTRIGGAICINLRSVREYVARNSSSVEAEVGRS